MVQIFWTIVGTSLLCPKLVAGQAIDPETSARTIRRYTDSRKLNLVMSDEFNTDGRSFAKGHDKHFEAIEKPDDSNQAMEFYNSSTEYVTTANGFLTITTRAVKSHWKNYDSNSMSYVEQSKNYTSGMIQSWNKFCFTGGVLELAVQLPGGSANASGLWPAAWLMGNLARATYQETTTNLWPWSYDTCGEIPDLNDKQYINACNSADFPESYGLRPGQGRGAPEIDIFEVMMGHEMPAIAPGVDPTTVSPPFTYKSIDAFMSTSLQVAPGMAPGHRPVDGVPLGMNKSAKWYNGIYLSKNTIPNYDFYGQAAGPIGESYMEDAISGNTILHDTHFVTPHKYRIEWQPGPEGYLHWYLDSNKLFGIEAASLKNATGAIIPEEPLYLIMNTAVSHVWGFPEPCDGISKPTCSACWTCYDCANPSCQCSLPEAMRGCKIFPAVMKVDYIRLYQDLDDPLHTLGCSPPSHPTAEYIAAQPDRFADWSPVVPAWYGMLELVIHILVAVVLLLSLVCSARYFCNPRYRTIGDVKVSSRSGHTSANNSPSKKKPKPVPPRSIEMTDKFLVTETSSLLPSSSV